MRTYKVIAEENKETIFKMIEEGHSKAQIYKAIKCNYATLMKIFNYFGIEYDYYNREKIEDGKKRCNKCNNILEVAIHFTGHKVGSVCNSCRLENSKIKTNERHMILAKYKESHGCKKCGLKKYYLLDFHHIDPSQKSFSVSQRKSRKMESIMEEIKKCVVLCSNCHREFHYLEKLEDMTIEKYLKE